MDKQSGQKQPDPPVTPPKEGGTNGMDRVGNTAKPDGAHNHVFKKAAPASPLEELFLFDPNFESCW